MAPYPRQLDPAYPEEFRGVKLRRTVSSDRIRLCSAHYTIRVFMAVAGGMPALALFRSLEDLIHGGCRFVTIPACQARRL